MYELDRTFERNYSYIIKIKKTAMKQHAQFAKLALVFYALASITSFSAFSQEKSGSDSATHQNRSNRGSFNRDKLSDAVKQLNVEMEKLHEEIKRIDLTINHEQINQALKQVDQQKMSAQIDESLKKIDWKNLQKDMDRDMVKINKKQLIEVKNQMEKLKVDLKKQQMDLKLDLNIGAKKIKEEAVHSMQDAKKSILKAKEEIKDLQEFTDALQKDGLIDKSKAYKVEVKEGQLYIDGKKQSKEVSEKYRKYYRKNNLTINMSAEDEIRI
ncbi:MAG: hypothetical protein JWQ40_2399 [Segetibacter sp.]|nr:hypothetical protein [Segetibacter sp.]